MWFESLTGFREESPRQVRSGLVLTGSTIKSKVNGRSIGCGRLEMPSLQTLRDRARAARAEPGRLGVREVVADVKRLHADPANAGAVFQVASQFNLLEMASPSITPERGVDIYESDHTQGPACAMAAGGGTIYRNYFAEVNGRIGQTSDNQIDCLADVGAALGNADGRLWAMRNGYALATEEGLVEISRRLRAVTDAERDALRAALRVGIQWGAQVTLPGCKHAVTQAYCSALPVAYSAHPRRLWEDFARLILEASYEAAFCTALQNLDETGDGRLFLTLLGGGAFGNDEAWILSAIERAAGLFADVPLDIAIVSYGSSRSPVRDLAATWSG